MMAENKHLIDLMDFEKSLSENRRVMHSKLLDLEEKTSFHPGFTAAGLEYDAPTSLVLGFPVFK